MKNILAISGSTRQNSSNHQLINAIAALLIDDCTITVFDGIVNLPHFNPDNNIEQVPVEVIDFREKIDNANGVLICTPEYAHGVPGALKNAIDWTVSSGNFSNKPTLLITAATDGQFGHAALMETLKVIEAKNIEQLQLVVPFIKTKINADNKIVDEKLFATIKILLNDFIATIDGD